jgi:hypothetical protein
MLGGAVADTKSADWQFLMTFADGDNNVIIIGCAVTQLLSILLKEHQ